MLCSSCLLLVSPSRSILCHWGCAFEELLERLFKNWQFKNVNWSAFQLFCDINCHTLHPLFLLLSFNSLWNYCYWIARSKNIIVDFLINQLNILCLILIASLGCCFFSNFTNIWNETCLCLTFYFRSLISALFSNAYENHSLYAALELLVPLYLQ